MTTNGGGSGREGTRGDQGGIGAKRVSGLGATIFAEMTKLANAHDAVNLGQGFPDFEGPGFLHEAAFRAIREGKNQYAPTGGVPELAAAIGRHQERFWDLPYSPDEIAVYAGATEGIFASLLALCDPGDEVVMFEPFYDSYQASITMAGARARAVTLRPPEEGAPSGAPFGYDPSDLEAAIGPRARAILLNTPHNPTGKVWSREELEHVADLCRRHDLLLISDEVYEHLVFEGEHVPPATLPGMRERTVTISSAAKTFSVTGWKIGWTCAPAEITRAIRAAHQYITFCSATPFQHAVAHALDAGDDYYETFLAEYRDRRDRLCAGLSEVGFRVHRPAGTYFVMADIRDLEAGGETEGSEAFCRMLPERYGVAAIPPQSFYVHPEEGRHLVRFAFCKTDAVLDEAIRRLRQLGTHPTKRNESP